MHQKRFQFQTLGYWIWREKVVFVSDNLKSFHAVVKTIGQLRKELAKQMPDIKHVD